MRNERSYEWAREAGRRIYNSLSPEEKAVQDRLLFEEVRDRNNQEAQRRELIARFVLAGMSTKSASAKADEIMKA